MQDDGKYRQDVDSKSPKCGTDAAHARAFALQRKHRQNPQGGSCADFLCIILDTIAKVRYNVTKKETLSPAQARLQGVYKILKQKREYIMKSKNPIPIVQNPTVQAPAAPVSAADEIAKLKQLLDDGAITEQEFEAQKKKLLNTQEQQQNPVNPPLQQVNTVPTKICKHCHANIPINAIRCPQCKKKQKSSAPILIAFLIVILLLFLIVSIGVNSSQNKSSSSKSNKASTLATEMNLTKQQETDMLSIFDQCGILEIKTVKKFQEGEGRTSYHIDDVETQSYRGVDNTIVVWIDNETKSVQEIYFNENDIYLDGQVIAKVSDYYISDKLRQEYRVTSQMLINQYINFPDTAKYPNASGWRFGVQDGFDVVQSTVEAENALKQKITENFQIKYDRKTGNPVSIIIGDQEYLS